MRNQWNIYFFHSVVASLFEGRDEDQVGSEVHNDFRVEITLDTDFLSFPFGQLLPDRCIIQKAGTADSHDLGSCSELDKIREL